MLIAYKYRLYPTEEQKQFLAKSMGSARFVYNWALAIRKADYEKHGL
jgi:putative transposase